MKNFTVVIIAFLYMGTSTGATLQLHYCMGKLADWGLGHNKSKSCGKCGMEKSHEKDNGCCKYEHKFLKNDTNQKAAESALQMILSIAGDIPASFVEISLQDFPSITEENPISHAPPRSWGIAVYIRNCTFLI